MSSLTRRGFFAAGATLATAALAETGRAAPAPTVVGKDLGKARQLPPGRYDEHIHVYEDDEPNPAAFAARLAEAGIAGGCVYSREQAPEPRLANTTRLTPEQIVDNVIGWCSASPTLYPFYWIDPSRPDSAELVDMAVEKGICGFKVIRSNGRPCDGYALDCYRRIAHYNKPLTFHSGILYDGMPSSEYFRPCAFEPLVTVAKLRFALAHVSWPWCDECLAFFGKMHDAGWRLRPRRQKGNELYDRVPEMFIDTAPGLKGVYRRDIFRKIYEKDYIGFNTDSYKRHFMFGTDGNVHSYRVAHCRQYLDFDDALFAEIGVGAAEIDGYYRANLERFLWG